MAVKSHIFRGKRYAINLSATLAADTKGEADSPDKAGPEIRVRRGERDLMLLDTLIHEGLHACLWDMDDEAVTATASDIARLLWRLGYRRQDCKR